MNCSLQKISLNKIARDQQKKVLIGLIAGICVLILIGFMFVSQGKQVANQPKIIPDMTGVTKSEFTGAESNAALQAEVRQVDELKKQMAAMQAQMEVFQKNQGGGTSQQVIQDMQTKIEDLTKEIKTQPNSAKQTVFHEGVVPQTHPGIGMVSFSYSDESREEIKNKTNYVPPGTFAKAVLLSGADTNAGANGQTDTLPITMRILDDGVLPNGEHSSLKGCFITAAAYGDASSERGQIRLQHLSCVRTGGRILDIAVEGTISDMGGNDGIRGHVVMRNGKLLMNAGLSGFLSGIGSAMQQSLTTQATSPLGTTTTIQPGKVLQYGAYGGANTALEKLADYYIKLAELYHPIVQIHAGSNIDVIFLKGFSLDIEHNQLGLPVAAPQLAPENSQQSSENLSEKTGNMVSMPPANLVNNLKNTQLGQVL